MTETAHLLVGAAIASQTQNPFLASALALFSHFLLDVIPHWDTGTNWRNRPVIKTVVYTAADIIIGTVISVALFINKAPLPYLLLIMFMSTLPDWLEGPYFLGLKKAPFSTIYKLQHTFHKKQQLPGGLVKQALVLVLFLFSIMYLPNLSVFAK